jgi:CBS domain-containing protein
MIVSQLMGRNLVTCRPQDSLHDAAGKMWEQDLGCLPVLDDDKRVVGILTDRDVCMAAFTQGKRLAEMTVDSAMTHQIFSCLQTDRVEDAEAVMKAHKVRRVPVVDHRRHLVGVISMNDIAREFAREFPNRPPDLAAEAFVATHASIGEPRQMREITVFHAVPGRT